MILIPSLWLKRLRRQILNLSLYIADRHWKLAWRRHSSRHSLKDLPVISEWNSAPASREFRYLWNAVSGLRPLENRWEVTEFSGNSLPLAVSDTVLTYSFCILIRIVKYKHNYILEIWNLFMFTNKLFL